MKRSTRNDAWCTKENWLKWHFYPNSVVPICGQLSANLLTDDYDVLIDKKQVVTDGSAIGRCQRCYKQGIRARLWK